MPTITDIAIVIRRWDFSETSQTVSLLTREHGLVRGLAKGAKREKGSFSGGVDVLTEGEIVAILKSGRDLATLAHWHLRNTHRALHQHLQANRAGLFMADLVQHMIIDHDPHPRIFDALSMALARMDENVADTDAALLRLQWAVLAETGYQPELANDVRSGSALSEHATTFAFSAASGGLTADDGAPDAWRVRRETVDVLRAMARLEERVEGSPESVRRANLLLASYCREIISADLPTMSWAFPDLTRGRERT